MLIVIFGTMAAFTFTIVFTLFYVRRYSEKQRKQRILVEVELATRQLTRARATLDRVDTGRLSRFESHDTTLVEVPLGAWRANLNLK